jgi:voltage-gated potassium channel Kch
MMRKLFVIGGIAAGVVLVMFGVAAIYMGVDGRSTVSEGLKQEQIVFGAADDPAVARFAAQWAGEPVETGTQARAFAQIIHEHATEASGGLSYAQMGRFVSADDPENPAGTSDEAVALKDAKGNPVSNSARDTWVTATALSTALNVSYMAQQMALFGIVVGVALLLSGIGFIVLALGGALRRREEVPVVRSQETAVRQPAAAIS